MENLLYTRGSFKSEVFGQSVASRNCTHLHKYFMQHFLLLFMRIILSDVTDTSGVMKWTLFVNFSLLQLFFSLKNNIATLFLSNTNSYTIIWFQLFRFGNDHLLAHSIWPIIWPIHKTLTDTTTPGQRGYESNFHVHAKPVVFLLVSWRVSNTPTLPLQQCRSISHFSDLQN